jgi:hypothetical protein
MVTRAPILRNYHQAHEQKQSSKCGGLNAGAPTSNESKSGRVVALLTRCCGFRSASFGDIKWRLTIHHRFTAQGKR